MKRALVLGGGGPVGIAWETAVLAGLLEGGVDARKADLVVGTSAGSVVGTHICHGRDPRELLEELRSRAPRPLGGVQPDMAAATAVFAAWASFDEMTPERCAEIGRMALEAETAPEDQWVAAFAQYGWNGWPEAPLLVTAVDCASGQLRAFDRASGVPIERAVAASCAVPAIFPPVTIDGRRYTDGGVHSGTSADLAQTIEPDVALIVAPMGASDRGIGRIVARQLAREKGELEAAGAKVILVQFDDAAKQAAGMSLMDPAAALPTAVAGEAHGSRLAADLRDLWR